MVDGEELDADAQRLVASPRARASRAALVVERGQPVDALDRAGRRPLGELLLERLGRRARRRSRAPRRRAWRAAWRAPWPTPPPSGIRTTRLPSPSATPVSTQTSSGGRRTGTGTRRGKPSCSDCASAVAVSPAELSSAARRSGLGGVGASARASGAVAHEADDVVQRRVVAQLQRVVALDPVGLADRREHLGLLDRVDPQVGLEIEIHVEQVRRDSPSARPPSPAPAPRHRPPAAGAQRPAPRARPPARPAAAAARRSRCPRRARGRGRTPTTWLSVG